MVVEIEQPGAERPVRQLGIPVKLGRTPGEHARLPGPALGEHTEEVLLAAGYSEAEVAELLRAGAAAGPAAGADGRDVPGVRDCAAGASRSRRGLGDRYGPGYQRARWCSTTPSPCASAIPPGSSPVNEPNGAR